MGNKAKWRSFSKEEIEQIVKNSRSNREVAAALGYSKEGGGTMQSLHKMYQELNLDTSHFLGQGWNKNNFDYSSFSNGTRKAKGAPTIKALSYLREQKCENCGITEWLGQPINLQVHHINGDHLDNSLENLQLLCPNCHSYTNNWRKKIVKKEVSEEDFVNALKTNSNIRQALLSLGLTGCGGNYTRARELIEKYNIQHLQKST